MAAWLKPECCLTIDYGQKAAHAEVGASKAICKALGLRHEVLVAPISGLGSGDMVGGACSKHSSNTEYWPLRNQYLITLAAMSAMQLDLEQVLIGSVISDTRHADGRIEFVSAMCELLLAQEGGISLAAPAIGMSSVELVRKSAIPIEVLAWAHSCHTSNLACGRCNGCNKHSEVMSNLSFLR